MNNPIQIKLSRHEVTTALEQALSQNFIDNLRKRHPNVALDSKLRGYVGELAFKKWAKQKGIIFKKSNIKDYSSGMDIDFIYERKNQSRLNIELKTSLIPDVDRDLIELMKRRDIKLIRRQSKSIEELDGDVHVQIIFKQLRLRKDDWLKKQNINLNSSIATIYDQLAAFRYEADCFLVGWIDKDTLVQQLNAKSEFLKNWKYGKREFWICNLQKEAKEPELLISYLKD